MDPRHLSLAALLVGCGAASVPAPLDARAASRGGEGETGTELSEMATLEARLSEAEAENAALRAALSSAHRDATAACGEAEAGPEPEPDAASFDDSDLAAGGEDDGARPVLRLYGPPVVERPAMRAEGVAALAGPEAPSTVAAPPPGTLGRLVVTDDAVPAIPASPIVVVPRAAAGASAPVDPAVDDYQDALRRVSLRDLDGALAAFASFLAAHPAHAYADNALYWRAEVFYARHEWTLAVGELEALLARFPGGSKVPDALLRLGMCWERLGDSARARLYFERLVREHPDSTAAHMAGREDT